MYEEAGEFTNAVERYQAILKEQPNNVMALNNLAYNLAVRQNRPTEGKILAERAVTASSGDPTVIDTLAWIEHLLGNDAEASRLMEPVVVKVPNNSEIHFHAAVIFHAVGKQALAAAQLAEALRLSPGLADREDVKTFAARLKDKR
jgi:Flp pilus assembly protein TadD